LISDLEVFIPFYTCEKESDLHWDREFRVKKAEGRRIHVELLQACIASVRKEGIDKIKVIDGSLNTRLRERDVDAEIIRNYKHGLAPAINIAMENAKEDFLCLMPATLVGVGNIERMIVEKKTAEEKFGKPVCLVDDAFYYPTNDEWFLDHGDAIMAKPVEWVKSELAKMGFKYTNDGQAIAKNNVGSEWEYCYYIGPNFLVNKHRLFEVGGADERCIFHRHADFDLAFRWLSFEHLLLFANSAKMHRLHATSILLCKEIHDEERKQGYFEGGDKYAVHSHDWHLHYEEYRTKPWVYREWLKKPYQEEYDRLRIKPFILGRVESDVYFRRGGKIKLLQIEKNGIKIKYREVDKGIIDEVFEEDPYRIREIPKNGTVIDLGAHIGTVTLRCAIEQNCSVYAYEPNPPAYQLLLENIRLNQLENKVKAFNVAVGKDCEWRTLYGGGSLYARDDQQLELQSQIRVRCVNPRVVFEANKISTCDFLKVDIELAEKEIFIDDFAPYLTRAKYIILEWHNYDGHIYRNYLEKLGFSVLLTGCGRNPDFFDSYRHPQPPYDPSFGRGMLYAHKSIQFNLRG
jgi:FkbM family methyltransferase